MMTAGERRCILSFRQSTVEMIDELRVRVEGEELPPNFYTNREGATDQIKQLQKAIENSWKATLKQWDERS